MLFEKINAFPSPISPLSVPAVGLLWAWNHLGKGVVVGQEVMETPSVSLPQRISDSALQECTTSLPRVLCFLWTRTESSSSG